MLSADKLRTWLPDTSDGAAPTPQPLPESAGESLKSAYRTAAANFAKHVD